MKIWKNTGMQKTIIRSIVCLMILCLLSSFAVSEDVSVEVFYRDGIISLKYMTVESARNAAESFTAAGSYEQAPEYRQYALSLIDILSMDEKDVNLKSMTTRLQFAGENEEFRKSLAENRLPSCESLVQYIQARQHEEAGEYIAALNIYKNIRGLLDSMDRRINLSDMAYQQAEELYRNGDYQAAAEIFQNLDYADSAEKYQQVLASHEHQWIEATCTEPRTCAVLGETEGEPLGHDWAEATCTEPKTCRRCGATEGEPAHDWQAASCTEPRICSRCGAAEGEPLGHDWQEAACTEPKICTRCGATDGEPLGHNWQEATCTEPKTCARCGVTEGEPLGHSWLEATYASPQRCARCGATAGSPLSVQIGSFVSFGRYEQDNNLNNGPEAVEWMVLDFDSANHKVLLLSRYGLDAKPYNTEYGDITWANCTLRTWLNGDFISNAFSAEERAAILVTEVDCSAAQGYGRWNTSGGSNTQDQIFLLSFGEANRYLGVKYTDDDDGSNIRSRITPTNYTLKAGAWTSKINHTADGKPS